VTEAQLSRNNIEMLVGVASFEDTTHVKVTNSRGSTVYEAANILIATGRSRRRRRRFRSTGAASSTATWCWTLVNLPKTLIVVGGGVIGVEYTCMFSALGVG